MEKERSSVDVKEERDDRMDALEVQKRSWIQGVLHAPGKVGVRFFVALVRFYQLFISPAFAPRCRFTPSCSAYAIETLKKDGLIKGSVKATWRVLRCNPFGKGGYDPP